MNKEYNKYSGMTLNERLYEAGLLEEFEKIVKLRDKNTLVEILKKVGLNEEDATWSAQKSINTQTQKMYLIRAIIFAIVFSIVLAVFYSFM